MSVGTALGPLLLAAGIVLRRRPRFATAAALFLLALSTLVLEANRGWSSVLLSSRSIGAATRRQLPMLLVPVAAGWLLQEGTARHRFGIGLALGLLAIVTFVPTKGPILLTATSII